MEKLELKDLGITELALPKSEKEYNDKDTKNESLRNNILGVN